MGQACGAQDSNAFAASMSNGYKSRYTSLPDSSTLTYEGVFNEHLFHAGLPESEHACAASSFAVISEGVPWLAVFLKSCRDGVQRTQPIDLSVVIDISGSMSWGMDGSRAMSAPGTSRIEHAVEAVAILLNESLRPDDGIAICTFNREGTVLQPLTKVSEINREACLDAVCQLQPGGGTTLSSGMDVGRSVFDETSLRSAERTKRILFLTDMDDMSSSQLGEQIKLNASDGIYVSIVGMGVDFNSQLTDTVTKNKGSNYFCATNEGQLRQCLLDDFSFNFFPCAFGINVHLRSGSLNVKSVFGTPFDTTAQVDVGLRWSPQTDNLYPEETRKKASQLSQHLPLHLVGEVVQNLEPPKQSVTEVNTLFPSRLQDGAMKGGLILVQLEVAGAIPVDGNALQVMLEYEDLQGVAHHRTENIRFTEGDHYGTSDSAIQQSLEKGLLLQRYAQVCRMNMDLINEVDDGEGLEVAKQRMQELVCAPGRLNQEVETWKERNVNLLPDDKMETVSKNFQSFAELFERAVEERKSEAVAREQERGQAGLDAEAQASAGTA